MTHLRCWWLLPLGACAWDPPLDPGADAPANVLSGDVVQLVGDEVSETWITLFAADDLGPPFGTGSPTTFTVAPASSFTGGGATLRSAPWTLTGIPDGTWAVGALVDLDRNFHPLVGALAGATCGDVIGAHVASTDSPVPAPLAVSGGEWVADVTILAANALPIERPVFRVEGPTTVSRAAFGEPLPPAVRLAATAIDTAFAEDLPLELGPTCVPAVPCADEPLCPCIPEPCGTALWVQFVDADADGVVDPNPDPDLAAAGILDLWPRVYLAVEVGTFEYEGATLADRYVTQGFPLLGELGALAAQGLPPTTLGPAGPLFPVSSLSVSLLPQFRHYHVDGADGVDASGPFDLVTNPATVPDGPWAVTVVSPTGQTWTVPNESAGAPPLSAGFDPATQGVGLTFGP